MNGDDIDSDEEFYKKNKGKIPEKKSSITR